MMRLLDAAAPRSVILIRLAVGSVFLSEGVQKFLYPAAVGAGRFARIGFDNADFLAPLVAVVEIGCGLLVLLGLFTRIAVIPLMFIMLTAMVTTKLPILLGQSVFGFELRKLSHYGFWSMAHEARTDWAMLLGALFLAIVGGGRWSCDALLARRFAS